MKKENNIGNVVAIIGLTGLALAALWHNTLLKDSQVNLEVNVATSTKETFVYYDNEKLPDCALNDKLPCAFSCAPDGMCIFIPNGREPLTKELIEKLLKENKN